MSDLAHYAGLLTDIKGFSEHSENPILAFARTYPAPHGFLQQPVAKSAPPSKVPQAAAKHLSMCQFAVAVAIDMADV